MTRSGSRHRRPHVRAAVAALLVLSGGALVAVGVEERHAPGPATAATPARTSRPTAAGAPAVTSDPGAAAVAAAPAATVAPGDQPLRAAVPLALRVPAIGVSSPLVHLGLAEDGSLEVPEDYSRAGWFDRGPSPGEKGAAVIAGHVDSITGPAVFYRLSGLQPGDQVLVDRDDGTTAEFVVEDVERYTKTAFPTDEVYGRLDHAELRLITCGGKFDRATGHYLDNVVVFARFTGGV